MSPPTPKPVEPSLEDLWERFGRHHDPLAKDALSAHYTHLAAQLVVRAHARRRRRGTVHVALTELHRHGQHALATAIAYWNPDAPDNPFEDYLARTVADVVNQVVNRDNARRTGRADRTTCAASDAHYTALAATVVDHFAHNELLPVATDTGDLMPVALAALEEAFVHYDRRNSPGGPNRYIVSTIRRRLLESLEDRLGAALAAVDWELPR